MNSTTAMPYTYINKQHINQKKKKIKQEWEKESTNIILSLIYFY